LAAKKKVVLSGTEKEALVLLHKSGVAPSKLSKVFGISTGSIAAFVANATRKASSTLTGIEVESVKQQEELASKRIQKKMDGLPQSTKTHRSLRDWVKVAESLAQQNGGSLPTRAWLVKNGYSGLVAANRRQPLLLVHIRQEKAAKKDGEVSQATKWLDRAGMSGLAKAMAKNPELFQRIEQTA
jgi:hypothetical protein